MQPTPEHSNSLELLRMLRGLKSPPDRPEPGFKSAAEWGKEWRMCRSKARKYIEVARSNGLLTERTYKLHDSAGRLKVVPHYKIDNPTPGSP